jgi:hypothetical protein
MNAFERMRRNEAKLSYEDVAELLEYDPENDVLRWRVSRRGRGVKVGAVAGTINPRGYCQVMINGLRMSGHRISWLLAHKRWPRDQLDHIDGIRHRLDPANLREVTNRQNAVNKKLARNNKSGVSGVYRTTSLTKPWIAQIAANNVHIHIGSFTSKRAAIAARRAAEIKYGFHGGHGLDAETREMIYG